MPWSCRGHAMVMPCKVPLLQPLLRGKSRDWRHERLRLAVSQTRNAFHKSFNIQRNIQRRWGKNCCSFADVLIIPFFSWVRSWLFLSKFCPWKVAALRPGSNSFDPFLKEVQGFMESGTPSPCCTTSPRIWRHRIEKMPRCCLKHCNSSCQPKRLAFLYFAWSYHDCLPFPLGRCFDEASYLWWVSSRFLICFLGPRSNCLGQSTGWDLETRFEPKLVGVQWQTNAVSMQTICASFWKTDGGKVNLDIVRLCFPVIPFLSLPPLVNLIPTKSLRDVIKCVHVSARCSYWGLVLEEGWSPASPGQKLTK